MVNFCLLLGVAGNETTAKLIATGVVTLDEFPDERARLAAAPSLWPKAVEELLRFDPPSHYQGRITTAPIRRHGEEIRRVRSSCSSTGRPTTTRVPFPVPTTTSPIVPSNAMWPLATAFTSVWVHHSLDSRRGSHSKNSSSGSRSMRSTEQGSNGSTRPMSAACRRCHSPPSGAPPGGCWGRLFPHEDRPATARRRGLRFQPRSDRAPRWGCPRSSSRQRLASSAMKWPGAESPWTT